ncbi:hypothetical protein VAEU17_1250012 [Vibrio aestuarianus]|nr:hypothetical protein VAEU17_1250012 [Vibrio aestuarianus]
MLNLQATCNNVKNLLASENYNNKLGIKYSASHNDILLTPSFIGGFFFTFQ